MLDYDIPRHGLRERMRRQRQITRRTLYPTTAEARVQLAVPVIRIVPKATPNADSKPVPVPEGFDTSGRFTEVADRAEAAGLVPDDHFMVGIGPAEGDPTPADTEIAEAVEAADPQAAEAHREDQRKARERAKRDRYNAKRKEQRAAGLKPTR